MSSKIFKLKSLSQRDLLVNSVSCSSLKLPSSLDGKLIQYIVLIDNRNENKNLRKFIFIKNFLNTFITFLINKNFILIIFITSEYVLHQSHLNFIKRSYILKPIYYFLLYLNISNYLKDIFLKSKKKNKNK